MPLPQDDRIVPIRVGNLLVGGLVGALIGATVRYLVAISFVYYIHHWGGSWWGDRSPDGELHELEHRFALWSACIGLIIGGLAGATCKPILGAALGAVLSALFCLGLFVLPASLALQMSGPNTLERVETIEILGGLAAMTLAGAFAGGIGAIVGRSSRKWGRTAG